MERKIMATADNGKLSYSLDCLPSEIRIVDFMVFNMSNTPWPEFIVLRREKGDVEFDDLLIGTTVAPGSSSKLEFTVTSPIMPGHYYLKLRLYDCSTYTSFGKVFTIFINVSDFKKEEFLIAIPAYSSKHAATNQLHEESKIPTYIDTK